MYPLCATAAAVLLLLSHSAWSQPCPTGLKCLLKQASPQAQATKNPGTGCLDFTPQTYPKEYLSMDQGMYPPMIGQTWNGFIAMEITVQTRFLMLSIVASYNALTPWHPTAIPTYYAPGFGLPVPRIKVTDPAQAIIDRNIAVGYAYHRITEALLPAASYAASGSLLSDYGLDPDYKGYTNLKNPADIGNAAGMAVLANAIPLDKWNQEGIRAYTFPGGVEKPGGFGDDLFPANYSDWVQFKPVNDPYTLKNITQWQPLIEHNGLGYFYQQNHITPQAGWTKPWALTPEQVATDFTLPKGMWPSVLDDAFLADYKGQADEVIKASQGLTDYWKMAAEHFDVKPLAFAANTYAPYAYHFGWDLTLSLAYDLSVAIISDANIVSWRNKVIHGNVRPVSAIRYLYGNTNISAYLGPGQGAGVLPGSKFQSYMRTMPHTEFPSGTSCICSAFAEFNELFIGSQVFNYTVDALAGCSTREPGVTPQAQFRIELNTKAEFLNTCTNSRLYAGVHFPRSISTAQTLCAPIGKIGYQKIMELLFGVKKNYPAKAWVDLQ